MWPASEPPSSWFDRVEVGLTLLHAADTIELLRTQISTRFGICGGCRQLGVSPMKLAYFDCFSGISGDMTLGALLDAGCELTHLRDELTGLQVPGWELSAEKVWKNGMAATHARVKTADQ